MKMKVVDIDRHEDLGGTMKRRIMLVEGGDQNKKKIHVTMY